MKLSALSLTLVLAANRVAIGFRVGSDGNNDIMKKAVEDALLTTEVKSPISLADSPSKDASPPLQNKILGTEVPCMFEYWSRPDIHTFGNMGLGGAVHAAMAPLATKIIDVKAYGGVDVRKNIAHELRTMVNRTGARVVDLCCGVGMSTRALETAFHDAEFVVGIDTSHEMISMAQAISGHDQALRSAMSRHTEAVQKILMKGLDAVSKALAVSATNSCKATEASYRLANAENTKLPDFSFDLVTVMYGFHEVPLEGRTRIINEAKRLLRQGGYLAIVDICPTYTPAPSMLAGEPFVIEYQQNIDAQLANFPGFTFTKRKVVVPGHVNLWLLQANA
jgi:ubiquinone/menaquinone biosynthesis C-methylase UbiE